jgi:hypothetical protein
MSYSRREQTTPRRIRIRRLRVAALLVVLGAIAAALGHQWTASSSSATARPLDVTRRVPRAPPGEADGAVPDGTTVFDNAVPGVAKLDSDLRGALRRAATDAANDGVQSHVDSGWRSPAYQEQLLVEAISKYGSEEEATLPPRRSSR